MKTFPAKREKWYKFFAPYCEMLNNVKNSKHLQLSLRFYGR